MFRVCNHWTGDGRALRFSAPVSRHPDADKRHVQAGGGDARSAGALAFDGPLPLGPARLAGTGLLFAVAAEAGALGEVLRAIASATDL